MKTDNSRDIQELLVDYAEALRNGSIPVFLQSLTKAEAKRITNGPDFWDGVEAVRAVTAAAFADKIITPKVDLFISRVTARTAARSRRLGAPQLIKRRRRSDAKLSN